MLIEVTDNLYADMSPQQRASCYVIPSTDPRGTQIIRASRSTNVSMNRWLRAALTAATGRSYVVQGGPTSTATGSKPPGAIDITYKGFRRAIQQYGLGKGLSDIDMRACCDWLSDSGVLYFEVDEDARGKLLRVLNGVVEPLPFVVKPYAGGVPRNLSLSKHNFDTWEAMREFSLQCVQSAIPTYTRSPDVVQRMYQLVRAFDEIPANGIRGKFSEQHWDVMLSLPSHQADSTISHTTMQSVTHLMNTSALLGTGAPSDINIREATLAAESAMAVALEVQEDAQTAAVLSVARSAAHKLGLPHRRVQIAAKAAVIAASIYAPSSWPDIFLGTVKSALGVSLDDASMLYVSSRLHEMLSASVTTSEGSAAVVHSNSDSVRTTAASSPAPSVAPSTATSAPAPRTAPSVAPRLLHLPLLHALLPVWHPRLLHLPLLHALITQSHIWQRLAVVHSRQLPQDNF